MIKELNFKKKDIFDFFENQERYKVLDSFKLIWENFNRKRKFQLLILSFTIVFSSISEILLIVTFIPFISIINNSGEASEKALQINSFLNSINFANNLDPTVKITIIFCIVVFFATFMRLLNIWLSTRISAGIGVDLSTQCFRLNLTQKYEKFLKLNSAGLISSVSVFINRTIIAINALLLMIGSFCLSAAIIATLLSINLTGSIIAFGFIGSCYLIISKALAIKLSNNSKRISNLTEIQIKNVQESLANVRDIILDNSYGLYLNKYRTHESALRRSQAENLFFTLFPRFLIEGLGFIILGLFTCIGAIYLNKSTGIIEIIGVLAIGMQRLLPSFQKVYQSFAKIKGFSAEIQQVINFLKLEDVRIIKKNDLKPLLFKDKVQLKNINFGYVKNSKLVLKEINLTIKKGENIGIIGKTGCGKSTLLDIFMSLLAPNSGDLIVDNLNITNDTNAISSWRSLITHVPQSIFLADASIEENIAIGTPVSEIDKERLSRCIEAAQLKGLISKSTSGLKTIIGERGILLSGGEKQRIGIARALYKQAEILIFDEATSALDKNTEELIINSIYNFKSDLTIISVAHRLTTLKKCDRILKLENNKLIEVNSQVINS